MCISSSLFPWNDSIALSTKCLNTLSLVLICIIRNEALSKVSQEEMNQQILFTSLSFEKSFRTFSTTKITDKLKIEIFLLKSQNSCL